MSETAPELPAWHARSFYAQILLIVTVLAQAAGIDLAGWIERLGFTGERQLLDFVVAVMPALFGLWAWLERRAPRFRLVFRRALT